MQLTEEQRELIRYAAVCLDECEYKHTARQLVDLLAAHNAGAQASPSPRKVGNFLGAPGMWAQVYCSAVFVRGFPSDMARGAADHAVQEFGSDACKTVADLEYTLDEVLRVD